ncbi:MAG: ATP-dependent DNA helicase RecG, partial [Proteobacteria bacterium]|nr:ATP-dependent DNA helicase RecG [Pseudomonadota bacterium]
MGSRPEILFPLFASCLSLKGVGQKTFLNLQRMKISRPRDIMLSLPVSGIIRRISKSVFDTPLPAIMTIEIQIIAHISSKTRGRPHYILVRGLDSDFNLVFFHSREDYLKTIFPEGEMRIVSGKVEVFDGLPQMTHPDYVVKLPDKKDIPEFEAVYPLTYGVTQKVFSKLVKEVLTITPELDEWIDPSQKLQAGWPDWKTSILTVHNPIGVDDFSRSNAARERLSYDEFFAHQLTLALARMVAKKKSGMSTCGGERERSALIKSLAYKLTNAQSRVISEILKDMAEPKKMIRLLQGDVGSGKTIVAFFSLITAVSSRGQAVLMAPTEILARQHYEVFLGLAKAVGVKVDILTGRDSGRGRKTKLEALASGSIQILVGTHAVFQQDVVFLNLRLVVVDEQHRFGVNQRLELSSKGLSVDVLVMTATPIPRSLALANFGDMEISILDEKPIGRKPIKTVMISTSRVKEIVEKLDQAIKDGRQIYWVCPLVEESELSDKIAVVQRFENLGTE